MSRVSKVFDVFEWANYVVRNEDISVMLSTNKPEPDLESGTWKCKEGRTLILEQLAVEEFFNKSWDKCLERRPILYDKCIGKIGRFWDNKNDMSRLGILTKYNPDSYVNRKFTNEVNLSFENFEPLEYNSNLFYKENEND